MSWYFFKLEDLYVKNSVCLFLVSANDMKRPWSISVGKEVSLPTPGVNSECIVVKEGYIGM